MHERLPKNYPIDTTLYEIDMIRHCARTLEEKRVNAEKQKNAGKSASEPFMAEYYLGIEGFLLHLRNLLAFFTNRRDQNSDLGINEPSQWTCRAVQQREYSDLIKRAREVDRAYGEAHGTCYDQISKFLQHCTTFRHERAKSWDIEKIFADLDPILQDFEERFGGAAQKPADEAKVLILGGPSNSTESFRT